MNDELEFDLSKICVAKKAESTALTVWIPAEYKIKFDLIQERSGKQFGKFLKRLLIESIDKVKLDEAS